MNKKFKVNQDVVCTWGSNKGKEFTIVRVLNNGYSCKLKEFNDGKNYGYDDNTLEAI